MSAANEANVIPLPKPPAATAGAGDIVDLNDARPRRWGWWLVIFGIGGFIEEPLIKFFDRLNGHLESLFPPGSLSLFLVHGVLHGISGGIAIVLPTWFRF